MFALYKGFIPTWVRLGPWNIIVSLFMFISEQFSLTFDEASISLTFFSVLYNIRAVKKIVLITTLRLIYPEIFVVICMKMVFL